MLHLDWLPTHVSGTGGHASAGSTRVITGPVPGGGDLDRERVTLDGLQLVLPLVCVRFLTLVRVRSLPPAVSGSDELMNCGTSESSSS